MEARFLGNEEVDRSIGIGLEGGKEEEEEEEERLAPGDEREI